ncbi:S8 family peptidase [Lacrimispora xylanolytica]|uniref:S8 family peptidase n=2 Tax=Clostridia TaxID=186801 RepID=A0ABY7AGW6_9FIRM|nr:MULTISPECIES: S8 family peptidase [Clostridia]WAJ26002.1 S8 family peptidase [Lacrimispora xylanolytica]
MQKIVDENYYDLIISNVMIPYYDTGDNITNMNLRHSLAHIPVDSQNPCNLGTYPYNAFPSVLTLSSTISLEKSGVGTVQRNPYLALFGRGILVAVIDTGIDYRHQSFLYNDGTTRIISLWDQTIQEGPPPEGFTYGTEYTREHINVALRSEDPLSIVPSVDNNGHGTAIASVIAGKPNQDQSFSGVVPEAELLIVKLKPAKNNLKRIFFVPEDAECYQESDLIIGINYVISVAIRLNRPVAICIAMGTNQSSHDGRGATSYYTNFLAQQPQTGITITTGNEANKRRHYFKNTTTEPFNDAFELSVTESDKLFAIELWPFAPARLSVQITSPNQETTGVVLPSLGECREFIFPNSQSGVWINNYIFEEETGDQLILMRFQNPIQGIWNIRVENLDNEAFSFHAWLPSGDLISEETFFVNSNPDTTITSPGNATYPLTVTAYNQFNDSILPESGRGFTRTGYVKPDISAPGFQLTCAVPGNSYGTITGSGCAAAHAAGIVAMVFEWAVPRGNYTNITGNDVNRLIIRGAQRNSAFTYPNNIWGYGQIEVNRLFEGLTNI